MPSDSEFLRAILQQQGIEYAVCDAARHILAHSPGLADLATSAELQGQRLEEVFDEFKGAEEELTQVARRETPLFQVVHTYRESRDGQSRYLTLSVVSAPPGLLVIAADATQEAQLAQRLMQERNEVILLRDQLKTANARLDYLLRHFVPASVAQQLMHQRELPRLGGRRRIVSVLFADVRGYTSLAEAMEPESVMELLNRHFGVMGRLIAERGGTINQYAGDMIMAIFNAPDDQPDHALRAVQVALEMQAALQGSREILTDPTALKEPLASFELPLVVEFGIGVNTGPAVVGYLGFEDRFDYTAIGDTTNVASCLSAVAQAGQVLLGPQTCELVRDHIRTRPVGPIQLKGKAAPLPVYEALMD